MFHTKFNIRFRLRLVLLEMNCFEEIIKRVLQKFEIQCKYSWYKVFVHLLLQRLADSVLIYFTYEPRDTFKSFGSFLTVKIISKLDMEHSVKFEIEI